MCSISGDSPLVAAACTEEALGIGPGVVQCRHACAATRILGSAAARRVWDASMLSCRPSSLEGRSDNPAMHAARGRPREAETFGREAHGITCARLCKLAFRMFRVGAYPSLFKTLR
jgi:hypothetical protein